MNKESEAIDALKAQINAIQKELDKLRPAIPEQNRYLRIGPGCRIAPDIKLWASQDKEIEIGENVNITRGAEIIGPVTIGDNCLLSKDAYIRSHTTIGNHVALGPFVRLVTDTHAIGSAVRRAGKHRAEPIIIGDGAWIGASTTVLPGVTIGAGAVIGAGSLVTRDIPDNALAYGIPAQVVRILA